MNTFHIIFHGNLTAPAKTLIACSLIYIMYFRILTVCSLPLVHVSSSPSHPTTPNVTRLFYFGHGQPLVPFSCSTPDFLDFVYHM